MYLQGIRKAMTTSLIFPPVPASGKETESRKPVPPDAYLIIGFHSAVRWQETVSSGDQEFEELLVQKADIPQEGREARLGWI